MPLWVVIGDYCRRSHIAVTFLQRGVQDVLGEERHPCYLCRYRYGTRIQKPEESTDRLCRCGRSTYQSGTGQSAGKIYPCTYVHGGSDYRYNLEGVDNLRLTGELIADIYMGKILKWNDARIAAVNSGKQLPDKEIYPVFRLDGSGTTYIFSDYLTKVSTDWKPRLAREKP